MHTNTHTYAHRYNKHKHKHKQFTINMLNIPYTHTKTYTYHLHILALMHLHTRTHVDADIHICMHTYKHTYTIIRCWVWAARRLWQLIKSHSPHLVQIDVRRRSGALPHNDTLGWTNHYLYKHNGIKLMHMQITWDAPNNCGKWRLVGIPPLKL